MDTNLRAALAALLDKIGEGWDDGCGCCSSESFNSDTPETVAVLELLEAAPTWIDAEDELPPLTESDPITGENVTETVLVTDGHKRPLIAYADLGTDWNPERGACWKLEGRDCYNVPFKVRYWHPLPETPTKD